MVAGVQGLAHGLLVWQYVPTHGPAEQAVVNAMVSHHFTFGGVARSYWDFYFGYALMGAFTCLVEAMLLWQLSRFADTSPALVRVVAAVLLLFNVGHALLAARFFILTPVVFDVAAAALLAIAWIASRLPTPEPA